jgi:transposase
MSLKLQFVERAVVKGANLTELCHEFGVSRQTGHKWVRRYRELGPLGLVDQSRRPDSNPTSTGEEVVLAILELRNRHPSWGPDKISRVLLRSFGPAAPSRTTVARALRRLGKVKRRRPPVRIWTVDGRPYVEVAGPDDLWTMDFKGWWRARNGQRCEPFTVRDALQPVRLRRQASAEQARGLGAHGPRAALHPPFSLRIVCASSIPCFLAFPCSCCLPLARTSVSLHDPSLHRRVFPSAILAS